MKKIVLLISLLFAVFSGNAQNISGIITDEKGDPVAGASVKLIDTRFFTTSDSNGKFEFKNVRSGNYQIQVDMLGYESQNIKIILEKESIETAVQMKISENLTNEVVINAIRAGKKTPVALMNISKDELEKNNLGQDIPYILNNTPSVVTSSDAGNGIGYSKLSIRGTDLTRINVSVNGIPLNDAESHGVWWVDLPDLSSSVENVQIQRGVGTSTTGSGAFGANINFSTNQLNKEAYGQLSGSNGSFNSYKSTIKAGSGLINKHFTFDLRLSKIHSDGFIDRARTDMESYFTSASYSDTKTLVKINLTSGKEETYQAWNGVPKVRLLNDSAGMQRYLEHELYSAEETENMFKSNNRTYNLYTYKNEVDFYRQTHSQAFISREINPFLMLNLAYNYTKGKGYYEQYRNDDQLSDYLIDTIEIGTEKIGSSDLIRRKWLDNDFYVVNVSIDYHKEKLKFVIGSSWQDYFGRHYGTVIWARFAANSEIDHQWYYNTGDKEEFNIFGKFEYTINKNLNLYADMQWRKIEYQINGIDDNLKDISQNHSFDFFNPKFGVNYEITRGQRIYCSFGRANREPSRTDFKDAPNNKIPVHETLDDYELGYSYSNKIISIDINAYYMDYKNQLVKTGKINDVGDPILINIPSSYRNGIEINSICEIGKLLNWKFNANFSRNKIKNLTEYVDNWMDGGQNEIHIKESCLSFSPKAILSNEIEVKPFDNFQITLLSKYVGEQYIDNSSSEDRKLDSYFVSNLRLSYQIKTKILKSIDIQFIVNNLFDEKYETDGWVYRYFYNDEYYNMDGYFPQAGINYMAGIVLNF